MSSPEANNIRKLLPADEYDIGSFSRISKLNDEQFEIIADDLLDWLKDDDSLLYQSAVEVLRYRDSVTFPYIIRKLQSGPKNLKENLIRDVVVTFSEENRNNILSTLQQLAKKEPALRGVISQTADYLYMGKPYTRLLAPYDLERLTDFRNSFSDRVQRNSLSDQSLRKLLNDPNGSIFLSEINNIPVAVMACSYDSSEAWLNIFSIVDFVNNLQLADKLFSLAEEILSFNRQSEFKAAADMNDKTRNRFFHSKGGLLISDNAESAENTWLFTV